MLTGRRATCCAGISPTSTRIANALNGERSRKLECNTGSNRTYKGLSTHSFGCKECPVSSLECQLVRLILRTQLKSRTNKLTPIMSSLKNPSHFAMISFAVHMHLTSQPKAIHGVRTQRPY
jgi:hypothetical protein